MKFFHAMVAVVVLVVATALPSAGQVLEGPEGPVEFVGLKEWTAHDLFEAIQAVAPDQPFHACAVVMEMELGFAAAAATSYRMRGSDEAYTVVVGVEDPARVKRRKIGSDTLVLPESWQELKVVAEEDFRTLDVAARVLHAPEDPDRTRELTERMGVDPESLEQVLALIDRADGSSGRRLAHEVLAKDASWSSRAIATLLLGRFLDADTSWHGLVQSLIDPEDRVFIVTEILLQRLIYSDSRRPVDWSAAQETLQALLDGTNPWAFDLILEVLVATDIDPEFGRRLARDRPDLLLAFAGAEHRGTRQPALAFLRTVSGEDFGTDLEAWTAWLSSGSH